MMDYLSVYLSYKQGQRAGSPVGLKFLYGFIIFLILFKPIVWVLKVTGIFALLQLLGLINAQGEFSFLGLFGWLIALSVLAIVLKIVGSILFGISNFLIGIANKK